jgi:hypothetical protein
VPGPLAYEPSVGSLVADVLGPRARVFAGEAGLARRVSWTLFARATGLGSIEGGEIVLAPTERAQDLMERLGDLAAAGISAIVVTTLPTCTIAGDSSLPVVVLSPDTDLRKVQGEIERYVARRRRELFALQQDLHRSLVDAAIGGSSVHDLLATSFGHSGKAAALDRSGDLQVAGAGVPELPESLLVQARMASHESDSPHRLAGPPPAIAQSVRAGRERHGVALLIGDPADRRDDDEAVLAALASACAIVLSRAPVRVVPAIDDVLRDGGAIDRLVTNADSRYAAVALQDGSSSVGEIERAVSAELDLRSVGHVTALAGPIVVVVAVGVAVRAWEPIVAAAGRRLGSQGLSTGIGREGASKGLVRQSVEEAFDALRHGGDTLVTRFETIELRSLLSATPGWRDFADGRLAPLRAAGPTGAELVRTLRAYLDVGRNAKEAARVLHVHRNTLLYRLRRIETLLRVDLGNAQTLFELDLACRILELPGQNITATGGNG